MENQNLLTGAVMLETMWKTRNKDLIDLISPFVFYAVSKECAPYEMIDQHRVLEIVKKEFGYVDMPISIIEKVLRRNPTFFKRKSGQYQLYKNLDATVQEITRRRDDCEHKIRVIGEQLAAYFETHLKSKRKYTVEESITELHRFFSKHGIYLGINRLEERVSGLKGREADYYIAQYLYEKRDSQAIEYEYVIELVKGYFLQSAIYLQSQNGNLLSTTYKDVDFYYDTPFLLCLLGFKTDEDEQGAKALHQALREQKGNFYYFPQTQHEVEGILNAYEHNIGRFSFITLEGLDAKRCTVEDVQRVKRTWQSRAESEFKTQIRRLQETIKGDAPSSESDAFNEGALRDELNKHIKWRKSDTMNADLESIIGIYKIRGGEQSEEIEHCRAVFVTTNAKLAGVANEYYKKSGGEHTFPLLITDSELAALTWVKNGAVGNLPETQLLRNAYMATQPTPEMLEKFGQVLERMQGEGKMTEEVAIAIKSSAYTNKEILFASFEGEDGINEDVALKIENALREKFSNEAREDERYKAAQQQKEEEHNRKERAVQQARQIADERKTDYLKRGRCVLGGISIIIIVAAVFGLFYSLSGLWSGDKVVRCFFLAVFVLFSLRSLYDTWKGTEKYIDRWLLLRANSVYDKEYEKRLEENLSIL